MVDGVKKFFKEGIIVICVLFVVFFIINDILKFSYYKKRPIEYNANLINQIYILDFVLIQDIEKISFYYDYNDNLVDLIEIKNSSIEDLEEINKFLEILKDSEKINNGLVNETNKIYFDFEGGGIIIDYEIDRKNKLIYGRDWKSKELYKLFEEKGIIKDLKIIPLPKEFPKKDVPKGDIFKGNQE